MRPSAVCKTEPGSHDRRADPGFCWTVLQRHGKRPLAVLGRVLLRVNNRCAGLPFWSELTIYETAGLHFAASLCHTQIDLAEPGWRDAWLCDVPEAVRRVFQSHDPLWALPPAGCPASYDPVAREAVAAAQFRGAWAGLLAAVFGLPATPRDAA